MSENVTLGNVADSMKAMMEQGDFTSPAASTPDSVSETDYVVPDMGAGAAVHIGKPMPHTTKPIVEAPSSTVKPIMPEGVDLGQPEIPVSEGVGVMGLSFEELRQAAPSLPEEEFNKCLSTIKLSAQEYSKQCMIKNGLTPSEANEAAQAFIRRELARIDNEYVAEHVNNVDVVIDKSQEGKVTFSDEERAKMMRAKTIKLVVIENRELESVRVKKVDVKHKAECLATLQGGLSKYSVPMPATGDYFTFRGAQIMQLASVITTEDEKMSESLMRRAQLLYDKFVGGTLTKKNDRLGHTALSFEDFTNLVSYNDVDIGLFGILCAGQMEESDTELTCRKCNQQWHHTYNVKTLMSMDGFSDYYKQRTDNILANSANEEALKLVASSDLAVRYKSPFTGNMYDLEIPSIAKANRVFLAVDPRDELRVYHSAVAIYLNRILVHTEPDAEGNEYLEFGSGDEEIPLLLDTLALIPDEDIKMLLDRKSVV